MFKRKTALHSLTSKVLLGVAAASTLLLAACGSSSTTTSTGGSTPTTSPLLSCTATVQDITESGGSQSTATKVSGVSGKLDIDGSSALAPLFTQLGKEFDAANGTATSVTANGSGTGLKDVNSGAVQIGMSDLFQADKKISGLTDHQVAVVAFTLVVNSDLTGKVGNLTSSQIQQIYSGQVTNWSQIGGPSENITVINRPTSSGTRGTFDKYVLKGTKESAGTTLTQDTTGAVFQAVNSTPGAIGYVSTGFVTGSAAQGAPSPICIDGFKANATDIDAGNYQFWNIEHAYTKGPASGNAKAFLQYAESSAVQNADLAALNFYQISKIPQSATSTHLESGAPAPESFYQS
jgi:phosphate transport system substrate-binding protein